MDVKALKDKILQLAIQGRLVEQDITDEPVKILLERAFEGIAKVKKGKELSKINDEEKFFDLPNGWEWIKLGNYCKLTDGIKTSNIDMPYLEVKYLRGKIEAKMRNNGKLGYNGELIILVDGENSGEVFKIPHDGYIGSTFKKLDVLPVFDTKFLQLIILKNKDIYKGNKTGSAIPHLNKNLFANTVVALPSLSEQKRIVAKSDELFALIDELDNNKQGLLQNIADTRNNILQLAIQGKLIKQKDDDEPIINLLNMVSKSWDVNKIVDDEKIFNIPSGWEWVKLKDICEKFKYGSSAKSKESGNIPVLRMGNIQGGKINWGNLVYTSDEAEINKYDLIAGDLLFNRTNSPDLVGKTAIYIGEQKAIYAGYLIRIRVLEGINSEYINLFMNSLMAKDRCKAVKTDGVSQSNINAEKLGEFVIPLPPLQEQKRIVKKVNMLMEYLDELENSILG